MIAQILLTGVGLWLMFAPAVLGYQQAAADSNRIVGPLLASVAFLGIFEISRGVRWANLPLGLWLAVAPLVLDMPGDAAVNSVLCGAVTLALAPVGSIDQRRYGGGWIALWRTDRLAGDPRS